MESGCAHANRRTLTRVVLLRRQPGSSRNGTRAAILALFERVEAKTPGRVLTADQAFGMLPVRRRPKDVAYVRRLLRTMASQGASAGGGNGLVELAPGRFRLRRPVDARRSGPLEPPTDLPFADVVTGRAAAVTVTAPAKGSRAAVLQVATELAAQNDEGLISSTELVAEVVARFGFATKTVVNVMGQMAGRTDPRHRLYSDLERVRTGIYRLHPSAGLQTPRRRSCRTEVLGAVERICAASADGTAHIDEVRQALSGSGYSAATIKTALRLLTTGERGAWKALERVSWGRYRLR